MIRNKVIVDELAWKDAGFYIDPRALEGCADIRGQVREFHSVRRRTKKEHASEEICPHPFLLNQTILFSPPRCLRSEQRYCDFQCNFADVLRVPRYGRAAFRVEENVEGMGGVTRRFTKRAKTCANGGDFALHRVYIRCRSSVSSGAEPLSCTSMSSSGISGQILPPSIVQCVRMRSRPRSGYCESPCG